MGKIGVRALDSPGMGEDLSSGARQIMPAGVTFLPIAAGREIA